MILLLSGEGATDIGHSSLGNSCWGDEFQPGPMARLVEQILEPCLGVAILDHAREHDEVMVYFAHKADLGQRSKQVKPLALPGIKSPQGAAYYRKPAYALARWAQEIQSEKNDRVLAVFFHDKDGTNNCPRTYWQDKRNSIIQGFKEASFDGGVAMLPNPKSEAWLLCALRHNYRHCAALEEESGNDASPNNLKQQLEAHLGRPATREHLNDLIAEGRVIARQIQMPSFEVFLESLIAAAQYVGLDLSALQ